MHVRKTFPLRLLRDSYSFTKKYLNRIVSMHDAAKVGPIIFPWTWIINLRAFTAAEVVQLIAVLQIHENPGTHIGMRYLGA